MGAAIKKEQQLCFSRSQRTHKDGGLLRIIKRKVFGAIAE